MELTVKQLAAIVEDRYGDPVRFCRNLHLWLHENGVTQIHLAARSGMDPANINRWLRGHVRPSVKNMLILDEALERILEDGE